MHILVFEHFLFVRMDDADGVIVSIVTRDTQPAESNQQVVVKGSVGIYFATHIKTKLLGGGFTYSSE